MLVLRRALPLALSLCLLSLSLAAIRQPIRKPTHDPSLPVSPLFEAIDRQEVEVTLIAKNSQEANLFITNTSAAPLSVEVPPTVGAVHVLPQFFPPNNGGPFNGQNQGIGNQPGNGQGQGQSTGGGISSGTGGNGNNNLFGNGVFSIPVERTIQLSLKTVCLDHGRPDPSPKMQYRLVPVEEVAPDAAVRDVLSQFAAGRLETPAAQAAAWRLTDGLTWDKLRDKRIGRIGGWPGRPQFTAAQLAAARAAVEGSPARQEPRGRR